MTTDNALFILLVAYKNYALPWMSKSLDLDVLTTSMVSTKTFEPLCLIVRVTVDLFLNGRLDVIYAAISYLQIHIQWSPNERCLEMVPN